MRFFDNLVSRKSFNAKSGKKRVYHGSTEQKDEIDRLVIDVFCDGQEQRETMLFDKIKSASKNLHFCIVFSRLSL